MLINEVWVRSFPQASAMFLLPGTSDHSPILVLIDLVFKKGVKPFKFFDILVDSPFFLPCVRTVWDQAFIDFFVSL